MKTPDLWKPANRQEAEFLDKLDSKRLPHHVAIIMDGNGRWAERRHLPRVAGHQRGVKAAREIIEAWRHDYNHVRPHSSLGALTPIEFANQQGDRPLEPVWGSAAVPLLNRPAKGITSTDSTYNCG